jgi:hypothetical protein
MKLNFFRFLGLSSLLLMLAIVDARAQEGTPNNEIPDLTSHPELNLNEDKTLLFEPDRNSSSEKSVQNKEQITITPSRSTKSKTTDLTQKAAAAKNPEDDALSFNFLYYIIQKFKISDIVEQ